MYAKIKEPVEIVIRNPWTVNQHKASHYPPRKEKEPRSARRERSTSAETIMDEMTATGDARQRKEAERETGSGTAKRVHVTHQVDEVTS